MIQLKEQRLFSGIQISYNNAGKNHVIILGIANETRNSETEIYSTYEKLIENIRLIYESEQIQCEIEIIEFDDNIASAELSYECIERLVKQCILTEDYTEIEYKKTKPYKHNHKATIKNLTPNLGLKFDRRNIMKRTIM